MILEKNHQIWMQLDEIMKLKEGITIMLPQQDQIVLSIVLEAYQVHFMYHCKLQYSNAKNIYCYSFINSV